jgi:hypothetical protein
LRLRIASCSGGRRSPATEAVQPTGAEYQSHCLIWFSCCHPKLPSWNLGAIRGSKQASTGRLHSSISRSFCSSSATAASKRRVVSGSHPRRSSSLYLMIFISSSTRSFLWGMARNSSRQYHDTMEPQICFPPSRIQKPRRPCARSRPVGASPEMATAETLGTNYQSAVTKLWVRLVRAANAFTGARTRLPVGPTV